jgi:hypothetical protein
MNLTRVREYLHEDVDQYTAAGIGLVVFGALFADFAFLILLNVPLTALGISCVVLGATTVLIPENPILASNIRSMIKGSCLNIEALLEEFDAEERCVYLPPRDGRVFAYVPLNTGHGLSNVWQAMEAPIRVVTEVGGEQGLMIFLPVSNDMLSSIGEDSKAEEALSNILVEKLEFLESVKEAESGDKVVVRMSGSRMETDLPRFKKVLGSLPTSIAGCVLAFVFDKPLVLIEEEVSGRVITATFEVQTKNG